MVLIDYNDREYIEYDDYLLRNECNQSHCLSLLYIINSNYFNDIKDSTTLTTSKFIQKIRYLCLPIVPLCHCAIVPLSHCWRWLGPCAGRLDGLAGRMVGWLMGRLAARPVIGDVVSFEAVLLICGVGCSAQGRPFLRSARLIYGHFLSHAGMLPCQSGPLDSGEITGRPIAGSFGADI